ncbi:paramyosin-like [Forsythia ovata]|uniref:Paramyosin-like n=1 Tax=Forsythia ovata TaxID=205694 RepID=A0ABD1UCS4_9LAMI
MDCDNMTDSGNAWTSKIEELEKLKEILKQAKDDAMQSWLDSQPLIDELEKTQAEIESIKARVIKANAVISELQAQLGTTDMCIKSTKEEELKLKTIIDDKNEDLERAQEEKEKLKTKIDEQLRKRSKLKQVLRIKRQSLLTFQLTHEAIQLESEAFEKSAAHALGYISNKSEAAGNIVIQLTRDEYHMLKRTASEQISLVEMRISLSMKQKLEAENSRDAAFRRLQQLYSRDGWSKRRMGEKRSPDEDIGGLTEEQYASIREVNPRNQQQFKSNKYGNFLVKKKKTSIFYRIRSCFARKFRKYFK